jgi:prevent-host-death family protein
MRRFSTVDLNNNLGDVKSVAAREPVVITEHRKDRFVLMSIEDYRRLEENADPRRVFGIGEAPPALTNLLVTEIDRVLSNDGGA